MTSKNHLPDPKTAAAVIGVWPDFPVDSGDHGWSRQQGRKVQILPKRWGEMGTHGGGATAALRRSRWFRGGPAAADHPRERETSSRERERAEIS